MLPPAPLVWTRRQDASSVPCRAGLQVEFVTLRLQGPRVDTELDADLLYCADPPTWYGPFPALDRLLMELALTPDDVHTFSINDAPVQVRVEIRGGDTVLSWDDYAAASARSRADAEAPAPSVEEVRRLPRLSETWTIGAHPFGWVQGETHADPATLVYVVAVLDAEQRIRGSLVVDGDRPGAEQFAEAVRRAAGRPSAGTPGRPARVSVEEGGPADALAALLQPLDVAVETIQDDGLASVLRGLGEDGGTPDHPTLTDYDPSALRAFVDVARSFFHQRPWHRFAPDKYLGFRIDAGPWRYLNAMGQDQEAFGVALFGDWLELCRFVHNRPHSLLALLDDALNQLEDLEDLEALERLEAMSRPHEAPLQAAGAMESLTLYAWDELHPREADYVRELGVKPLRGGAYPAIRRFLPGPRSVAPSLSLADYVALMEAVTTVLKRRSTPVLTSVKQDVPVADGRVVELRYPADGTEPYADDDGAVEVTLEHKGEPGGLGLPEGQRVVVTAAAAVPFHRILTPIRAAVKSETETFYVRSLRDGRHALWFEPGSGRGGPSPALAALVDRTDLQFDTLAQDYRMHVRRRPGSPPSKPEARMEPA